MIGIIITIVICVTIYKICDVPYISSAEFYRLRYVVEDLVGRDGLLDTEIISEAVELLHELEDFRDREDLQYED